MYLVGQNVHFDYGFLLELWKRQGDDYLGSFIHYHKIDLIALTCAFKMAGILDKSLISMKLQALCDYFGLERQTHDACSDIRQTKEIFDKFINHLKNLSPLAPKAII